MQMLIPSLFTRRILCGILIPLALIATSCGTQQRSLEEENRRPPVVYDDEKTTHLIPVMEYRGNRYVSLDRILELAEFQSRSDAKNRKLSFGGTDILYTVKAGSVKATVAGQSVTLPQAPFWEAGEIWLTPATVDRLLGNELRYEFSARHLVLRSTSEPLEPLEEGDETQYEPNAGRRLDFAEDTGIRKNFRLFANKKATRLIRRAKNYLGVKYEFGAAPYNQSGKFDCSSFVRHVYRPLGIQLPRISRNQAKRGKTVSRKNLRKGDLLFFYVPGRFRSNKTVGHVGIYIGNGKMIHASPKPKNGVQITNIHKPYWKRTFLKAKRVL